MKLFLKLFLLFFLFISIPGIAQENTTTKEDKKNEVASAKVKRQKAKNEWKERRKQEKAEKKAIKAHEKKLQTKETRKRMKKDRKKANRNNQNKKEFFLIRLFKPKPKTGGW